MAVQNILSHSEQPLEKNEQYQVIVSKKVKDKTGTPMAKEKNIRFKVGEV